MNTTSTVVVSAESVVKLCDRSAYVKRYCSGWLVSGDFAAGECEPIAEWCVWGLTAEDAWDAAERMLADLHIMRSL